MRSALQHSVKFYASDESLYSTVGQFVGHAIADGNAGVIIATADHRPHILQHIAAHADLREAREAGRLVSLDAGEMLAHLMIHGSPDEAKFDSLIRRPIERLSAIDDGAGAVCAYGEMVDVLWKAGKPDAAIRLEMLWNTLASRCGFSLLCGYSMGNFFKDTRGFESVCAQHTHVVPPA